MPVHLLFLKADEVVPGSVIPQQKGQSDPHHCIARLRAAFFVQLHVDVFFVAFDVGCPAAFTAERSSLSRSEPVRCSSCWSRAEIFWLFWARRISSSSISSRSSSRNTCMVMRL